MTTPIPTTPPVEIDPAREWRCFHCDEVFTTIEAAREHFGSDELCEPACQIDIAKFREMENYCARCRAEDSDSDREFHRMRADHAQALIREEEKGYAKGVADGREESAKAVETYMAEQKFPKFGKEVAAAIRERGKGS